MSRLSCGFHVTVFVESSLLQKHDIVNKTNLSGKQRRKLVE